MKLVVDLAEDAELRKAVLELVRGAVRTEIRDIISDEIKKMVNGGLRQKIITQCVSTIAPYEIRRTLSRTVEMELIAKLHPDLLRKVVNILTTGSKPTEGV